MTDSELVGDTVMLCRVCFDWGDHFLHNYKLEVYGTIITAKEMYQAITKIRLDNENLPEMICSNCLEELITTFFFYKKIENSEIQLLQILKNLKLEFPEYENTPENIQNMPVLFMEHKKISETENLEDSIEMLQEKFPENDIDYTEDRSGEIIVEDYQYENDILIENIEESKILRDSEFVITENVNLTANLEQFDDNDIENIASKLTANNGAVNGRRTRVRKLSKNTDKKKESIENGLFVVGQFVPSLSTVQKTDFIEETYMDELRTMDYAAVEIKGSKVIEVDEKDYDVSSSTEVKRVYYCQYCPRAFASSQFLITHVRKSHVCKYCTKAFEKNEQLFEHIRKLHNNHKCVVCKKNFSSNSNLRHHLKNVHDVKLPHYVSLLSFKKNALSDNENTNEALLETDKHK